jgi:glycosyltransferase involved in cell wall biosynthesis
MFDRSDAFRVTALIPVKNGEKYLNSFLPQVLTNLNPSDEILIINDHSDDGTEVLLNNWKIEFPSIRILKPRQSGLVEALNIGLKEASNDWVARFDCDDNYDNSRIRKQIAKIEKGDVGIFSDYSIVGQHGKFLGEILSPVNPIGCSISLVNSERTAHPSALFNRKAAQSVGGYRKVDYLAEDLSLWLRLSRIGTLRSVPETLLYYTFHSGSITNRNQDLMKKQKNMVIRNIGLNKSDLNSISTDFKFDSRQDFTHSHIRRILYARDALHACSEFNLPGSEKIVAKILDLIRREPSVFMKEASSQVVSKILRNIAKRYPRYF